MLTVDRNARTIYGRAIPWNIVSLVNSRYIGLFRDSLTWPGLVQLLIRHNHSMIAGTAIDFESATDGLYVMFRVRNGPEGDRAMARVEAGWGLSAGFDMIDYIDRGNALWCNWGEISEISLVPNPAFP